MAEARIKGSHTNFVFLRKNSEVLLDRAACSAEAVAKTNVELSMRKVYEFATESPLSDLRFILEAKTLNENASRCGLEDKLRTPTGQNHVQPTRKGRAWR